MNLVFVLGSVNNIIMYIDEDVFVCWYIRIWFLYDVSYRNYIIKCEGMCCFYNVIGIECKFIFKVNF